MRTQEEAAFREFIRSFPSVLDGDKYNIECAHVRRSKFGSGVAIKPAYYAIPLTAGQHMWQHKYGEFSCLKKYHPEYKLLCPSLYAVQLARDWFEEKAIKFHNMWLNTRGNDGGHIQDYPKATGL